MPQPNIHDDVLGILHWDDRLRWYQGEREIAPGHKIAVSLSPEGELFAEELARAAIVSAYPESGSRLHMPNASGRDECVR